MSDDVEPDWADVVADAKANRLGVDEDAPAAKGDIVAELRRRGFSPGFFDRAVEEGILGVVDTDGVSTTYDLVEGTSAVVRRMKSVRWTAVSRNWVSNAP